MAVRCRSWLATRRKPMVYTKARRGQSHIPFLYDGSILTSHSSFVSAWREMLQRHESIAASHLNMANMLKEVVEELQKVLSTAERERKQVSHLYMLSLLF